ncbi:MAG TPA: hypothetical protein VHO68_16230, partial [Bacteroidales bacterium]|nr:hypothetical protein [Bacteroidales bacterium]
DSPKQTIAGILNNGTICAGARVRIAPGTYNEKELKPIWNNAPAQGKGSVFIEGQGASSTRIIHMPGIAGNAINITAAGTLASAEMPVILKDLDISVSSIQGTDHGNYAIYNKDTFVKTINCRIGSTDNDMSTLVKIGSPGAAYSSENSIYSANISVSDTNRFIIDAADENSSIKLKNCIFLNGWNAFNIDRDGTSLELKNCTFFNIVNHAVIISAAADVFIRNCIFSCGSAPIVNATGSHANLDVDYNLYSKPNRNLFDGSFSLPAGSDPRFTDPVDNNFHLQAQTPCRSSGVFLPDVTYDFTGRTRSNPPSIGAFEK